MVIWGGVDNEGECPPMEIFEVGSLEPYWSDASMAPGPQPSGRVGHTMVLLAQDTMLLFGGVELHPKTGDTLRYHNSIWLLKLPPPASCVRSTWAEAVVGNTSEAPCSSLSTSPTRWKKHGDCMLSNGCQLLPGVKGHTPQCVDICSGQSYEGCPDPGCQWRSVGSYQWRQVALERHKGYPYSPSPRAFHTAFVADGVLTIYGGAVVAPGTQSGSWVPGKSKLLLGDDGIWEFRPFWETHNGTQWTGDGEWRNQTRLGNGGIWPPSHVFHTSSQLGGWNAPKDGAMVVWGGLSCDYCEGYGPGVKMDYRTSVWCLDILLPAPGAVVTTLKTVASPGSGEGTSPSVLISWAMSPALDALLDHITAYEIEICVQDAKSSLLGACRGWSNLVQATQPNPKAQLKPISKPNSCRLLRCHGIRVSIRSYQMML